jgi:hypothetical protein
MATNLEYVEEPQANGGSALVPATRWIATQDTVMDLSPCADWSAGGVCLTPLIGEPPPPGADPKKYHGTVKVRPNVIRLKQGETVLLPSSMDWGIHQTMCNVCTDKRLYCRDLTHANRDIVGGVGVYLRRVRDGEAVPAKLHASIDPSTPQAVAPASPNDASLDARIMARAQLALAARAGVR